MAVGANQAVVGDRLTWLGHATVLLELSGTRLLTDPVLGRGVAHLRRHVARPVPPDRVDAVLISHVHRDHLDLPSLRRLDERALVVVPPGARRSLRRLGRDTIELAPGEQLRVGGVRVSAVPAVHTARRSPFSRAVDAVGYVVEGEPRVYFAGDTERHDAMAALAPLDCALLPVWGWGWSLGTGHMDPDEAAHAVAMLRPALAVPIHWGTFLPFGSRRRHLALLRDPPHRFAARAAELAPDTRVEILAPGGSLQLRPASR
jgi:L-ascorbate metabolism protein UlaG (beta-lactamase superfamily)